MAIVERAQRILTQPRQEWSIIESEAATPASIYTGYVVPLAAIGPIASAVGGVVFGHGYGGLHARLPMGAALRFLVVQYVAALLGTFVLALIIEALAPAFGARKDRLQALKLAAYSSTAAWLAGIFGLIPALGFLGILGLYSLFLLWTGLPALMKAAPEKATPYAVTVVVAAILVFMALGATAAAVAL